MYFRLCKSGYAQSIREAKEMSAREVLQALGYDEFCSQYETAYLEMNR